jgi:hypothetical protein
MRYRTDRVLAGQSPGDEATCADIRDKDLSVDHSVRCPYGSVCHRVCAPNELLYPTTDEGHGDLEANLKDEHNIVLNPTFAHEGRIWLSLTAQRLARRIRELGYEVQVSKAA